MKRIAIIVFVALFLLIAYASKPDDKKCIIVGVKAVWGNRMPDEGTKPQFYEQFMDATSEAVEINDWIFLKRIKYEFKDGKKTIGFGAFSKVFTF